MCYDSFRSFDLFHTLFSLTFVIVFSFLSLKCLKNVLFVCWLHAACFIWFFFLLRVALYQFIITTTLFFVGIRGKKSNISRHYMLFTWGLRLRDYSRLEFSNVHILTHIHLIHDLRSKAIILFYGLVTNSTIIFLFIQFIFIPVTCITQRLWFHKRKKQQTIN